MLSDFGKSSVFLYLVTERGFVFKFKIPKFYYGYSSESCIDSIEDSG